MDSRCQSNQNSSEISDRKKDNRAIFQQLPRAVRWQRWRRYEAKIALFLKSEQKRTGPIPSFLKYVWIITQDSIIYCL